MESDVVKIAAGVFILATLLVGCGSSSQSATTSTQSPGAAPAACHTADLRASIGEVSAASGKRKVNIYLTNTSNNTCTLEGYPGIQPAQSSGTVMPYSVSQSPNPGHTLPTDQPVRQVTLKPSMTAAATMFYTGMWITDADKKTCVNWTALAVTPPGEHDSLLIPNTDVACMDPIQIGPLNA